VLSDGLNQFLERLSNGRPHVGIVVQWVRKATLLGRDGETGVLQLHRAGSGGQSFLPEIPRQVAEKSAQGPLKKWTIMCILVERGLVTETFRFPIGHHRFVVDPSRQFSNPVQSRAEDMTQGLIPAWVQQLADRL